MRYVAMISLTGIGDTYLMDLNHNLQLYVRPEDHRVLIMPWDYDFAFFHRFDSPLTGRRSTNLTKSSSIPHNLRLLYGHMLDLIKTSYNTTYLDPWIENYTQRTGFDDLAPFFHDYVHDVAIMCSADSPLWRHRSRSRSRPTAATILLSTSRLSRSKAMAGSMCTRSGLPAVTSH